MGRVRPAVLILVLGLLLPFRALLAPVWAQEAPVGPNASQVGPGRGGWSEPVRLSGPVGGWFPDVAADDTGKVHVVWNGDYLDSPQDEGPAPPGIRVPVWRGGPAAPPGKQVTALYYTAWDGNSWSRPVDLAVLWYGFALRSSIAADSTGRVHLVYKGAGGYLGPTQRPVHPLESEDVWYTWVEGPKTTVAEIIDRSVRLNRSWQAYFSDIAIDSSGVLHVIWTESESRSWGVYYARSVDGGASWSRRVPLDDSEPVWWYRAQLRVDRMGRLHAVWETLDPAPPSAGNLGGPRSAVYAQSGDGGGTWLISRLPDVPAATRALQPTVGIDGDGRILLVYREAASSRVLYRQSSNGREWSQPQPLPGVDQGVPRPYDVYDTVTDSLGQVHLVLVGYPRGSNSMALLHARWDGRAWSDPVAVSNSPPYPEYPRLAVNGGNRLHLVWFNREPRLRPEGDQNPIGIWYSSLETGAPRSLGAATAPPIPPRRLTTGQNGEVPLSSPVGRDDAQLARPLPARRESEEGWLAGLKSDANFPLLVGLLPAALVGVAILLVGVRRTARRSRVRHVWPRP